MLRAVLCHPGSVGDKPCSWSPLEKTETCLFLKCGAKQLTAAANLSHIFQTAFPPLCVSVFVWDQLTFQISSYLTQLDPKKTGKQSYQLLNKYFPSHGIFSISEVNSKHLKGWLYNETHTTNSKNILLTDMWETMAISKH